MTKSGKNRFVEELEEVNRKSSPTDIQMLREFNLMIKRIEDIPGLSEAESTILEENPRQPITLELIRHCFGRST